MKNLLKMVLLFASCVMFSSVSYADAKQDSIAKGIASIAKQGLIEEHGRFPI